MSIPDDPLKKSQEFAQMFPKAKEFTEELLKENERLRFKLAGLEPRAAAGRRADARADRAGCASWRRELQRVQRRYREVEEENKEFADRYVEIEEQNNNLANLYVASYQLHSTLDFKEVVRIVQEIVINLIGAEAFHIFMVSEKTGQLELEASEGQEAPAALDMGEGIIGTAAAHGRELLRGGGGRTASPRPSTQPIAVIPLKIKDSVIGVDLHQQAARPEDGLHHAWTTSCSRSWPATRPPPSSRPSSTPPPRGSSPPCRASSTCSRQPEVELGTARAARLHACQL